MTELAPDAVQRKRQRSDALQSRGPSKILNV